MADEIIELTEALATIDGLSSPTDRELVYATRGLSDGAIARAAVQLAGGAIEAQLPWIVVFVPWVPVPGSAISGSWNLEVVSTRLYNGDFANGGDDTDFIEWPVVLGAGTWTLQIMGTQYSDSAILTCSLDGSSIGTMDWYSAGVVENHRLYVADFPVATSGKKIFRIATEDKNASSSGYMVRIQHLAFTRTA